MHTTCAADGSSLMTVHGLSQESRALNTNLPALTYK